MTTILQLTDGTRTASLKGSDFQVMEEGWAPKVAGRRRSTLGGGGPYADVVEDIWVHVLGTSVDDALENLALLTELLDQAERWKAGEPVAAVRLQYQPDGAAALVECVILGMADSDTTAVTLPATFNCYLTAAKSARSRSRIS